MAKIQTVSHDVNGTLVEQRVSDGFINATAMCSAHGKLVADWFRNQESIELLHALALDLSIDINYGISHNSSIASISAVYPQLVFSKRGSPDTGGGTWLHPDLAIQLAQWCNAAFAIQVSKWVREWITTGQNPVWSQEDIDRVSFRATLKDDARLRMTDQVKVYLQEMKRYDDKRYRGIFFAKVHDAINRSITGETAGQMRERLSVILGKSVKQDELIRDYFPAIYLQQYIAVCEATANFMIRDEMEPLEAVRRATEYFLPASHVAIPIDFVEHIKFVRKRLNSGQINLPFSES